MTEEEGVDKIRAALVGSADTYADGDFNLTIYYEDLDRVARQVFRAVWGRECTCGIPEYGPGLEHAEDCPRREGSAIRCAYPREDHGDGRGCGVEDCPRHGGRER